MIHQTHTIMNYTTRHTVGVEGKIYEVISISKFPAGYGHNEIRCTFVNPDNNENVNYMVKTNNTILTDRMTSDDEMVEQEARTEAAQMVIESWLQNSSNN